MKLLIIDGQGGKMGKMLIELILAQLPELNITAVGTNSMATAAMIKAGATQAATGENPVVYNCVDADLIAGPIGIIAADSLLGEVTAKMAAAVGASRAYKVLIPVSKCNLSVAGLREQTLGDYVRDAAAMIINYIKSL